MTRLCNGCHTVTKIGKTVPNVEVQFGLVFSQYSGHYLFSIHALPGIHHCTSGCNVSKITIMGKQLLQQIE